MNRNIINFVRFIIEELIPPIIRDSILFEYLVNFLFSSQILHKELKQKAIYYSQKKFKNYYCLAKKLNYRSDNSEKIMEKIISFIKRTNILDVGCGSGYLLEKLRNKYPNYKLTGTEINIKKICKKRLIIICPKERPYKYTF